ncbi:MAG: T9SS type A sorting domain-containing protein [Saprospirales bacterium]|nr:T9SS type A sorting domain-containing protein [Saprospirales bacterium]
MIYALTGEELVDEIIALPITTLAGNPVALEDETGYIVMVEFQTDQEGTTIDMGFSQDINYGGMISSSEQAGAPRYGSLLGVAGNLSEEPYSTVGFGFDVVPVVRFSFGEPSSANDILLDGAFSVFPNPVSNEISLDMNFTEVMQDVTVQMFDLNGKLLGTKILDNVKQQTATFDVRGLANGAYFLKVTTEKGTRSERFQVQR